MGGPFAFKFGLPPSLGREPSFEKARELAPLLDHAGFSMVIPCKTYEELEQKLCSGALDLAWGPPYVCARVEAAGGTITDPIFEFPGGRRFHFRDPGGNELAAMQVDPR